MRAECIKGFRDLKEGVLRKEGDTFDVTAERFEELNASKYGQLVREVKAVREAKTRRPKGD